MKRGLMAAAAVLAVVALAYAALWFHGASRMKQAVADWKQEAESNGLTITYAELEIGGFPFELSTVVRDFSLRNETEGARIEAAPIRLRTTLWDPNRVAYEFTGRHSVTVEQGLRRVQTTVEVGAGTGEVLLVVAAATTGSKRPICASSARTGSSPSPASREAGRRCPSRPIRPQRPCTAPTR